MSLLEEARKFTIRQRISALKKMRNYLPNSPDDDRRSREIDLLQNELDNFEDKK